MLKDLEQKSCGTKAGRSLSDNPVSARTREALYS